jgi:hypothetical protein
MGRIGRFFHWIGFHLAIHDLSWSDRIFRLATLGKKVIQP